MRRGPNLASSQVVARAGRLGDDVHAGSRHRVHSTSARPTVTPFHFPFPPPSGVSFASVGADTCTRRCTANTCTPSLQRSLGDLHSAYLVSPTTGAGPSAHAPRRPPVAQRTKGSQPPRRRSRRYLSRPTSAHMASFAVAWLVAVPAPPANGIIPVVGCVRLAPFRPRARREVALTTKGVPPFGTLFPHLATAGKSECPRPPKCRRRGGTRHEHVIPHHRRRQMMSSVSRGGGGQQANLDPVRRQRPAAISLLAVEGPSQPAPQLAIVSSIAKRRTRCDTKCNPTPNIPERATGCHRTCTVSRTRPLLLIGPRL